MSITSLPVELISIICSHLQLFERKMLRLSCRKLCKISSEEFFDRYFKTIYFIVTGDSLRRLEDLVQSDNIRTRVQELWMIPTVFEGLHNRTETCLDELRISSKSCQPVHGDKLKALYTTYKAIVADSSNLLNTDVFSGRLSRCLEKLENLNGVGLAHYPTTFLLDPRQRKVRFLGWRHLIDQIAFRFCSSSLSSLENISGRIGKINSLALSRLLQALSGSGQRIRKLHTCNPDWCADVASEIAITKVQFDFLLPVLDRLEDLHLCIDLESNTWPDLITKISPSLKKLRISQKIDYNPGPRAYYFGHLCERAEFIQLRELHLDQIQVTSASLKSMLTRVKKTLAILTLTGVRLIDNEIKSANHDIDSPGQGASNTLQIDSPACSQLWYTYPPYFFYPRTPTVPPPARIVQSYFANTASRSPAPSLPSSPTQNYSPLRVVTQGAAGAAVRPLSVTTIPIPPHPIYVPSTTYPSRNFYTKPLPQVDFLWKGLWNFFGDELLLQKLSMAKLASGVCHVSIKGAEGINEWERPAIFDAERDGTSLREWVEQLTSLRYSGPFAPHIRVKEHEIWFKKMMPADSILFNTLTCTCDRDQPDHFWPSCPFGCVR